MKRIEWYLGAIFTLSVVVSLSGCSVYSNEFDCKYQKGVSCKSISEVNHRVDMRELEESRKDKDMPKPLYSTRSQSLSPIAMGDDGMIQRVSEEHLRVWIAPYQDEQGNFHEASVVHTVIKPGHWQLLEKS